MRLPICAAFLLMSTRLFADAFLWDNGSVTNLGSFGGFTTALAINDSTQIVGYSFNAAGFAHAFSWENGILTDLGTLPGTTSSAAYAVNNLGQVVGTSDGEAFLWQNGSMTDIGPGVASGINDLGQVVVYGARPTGAYIWQAGVITDLPRQNGASVSPFGINNSGEIIGGGSVPLSFNGVAVYSFGGQWDYLFGAQSTHSEAHDINNNGQIVGAFNGQPFVDTVGGTLSILPFPGLAYGNNDAGSVVGISNATTLPRAFVWDGTSVTYLGLKSAQANGINDSGQIVGIADLSTPEPSFAWAVGLCLLAALRGQEPSVSLSKLRKP